MISIRILIVIFALSIWEAKAQKYPYTFQADVGLLLGDRVVPVPSVQVFNGVRIDKRKIEAGLTLGIDVYSQFLVLPASATLKWMPFRQKAFMPYLNLNAGYGLPWLNRATVEKDYRGGFQFSPVLGLRLKTKNKTRINFGGGFKYQEAAIVETQTDGLGRVTYVNKEKYKFGRLSLTFGVGF